MGSGQGRATRLAAVVGAAFVVAACGGGGSTVASTSAPAVAAARAPTTTAPTPQPLCKSISSLVHLVVTRTDEFPQNHLHFAFPAKETVGDQARVRAAAIALCALPVMPPGAYHCPADFGVNFHLAFSASNRAFGPVSADATGCEGVDGPGLGSRWVATSPAFWVTLGKAMGLAKPSNSSFRGSVLNAGGSTI